MVRSRMGPKGRAELLPFWDIIAGMLPLRFPGPSRDAYGPLRRSWLAIALLAALSWLGCSDDES
jgi:hypothetical protein